MADSIHAFSLRMLDSDRITHEQVFAATRAVTLDLTKHIRSSIQVAAAPGQKVKGKRGKPVKVGAGYAINAARREGFVFARGPLQLIENDTKPHREPKIVDKARRRRTSKLARDSRGRFIKKGAPGYIAPVVVIRKEKTLKIPGIGYRKNVHHPGTRGKHPFMRTLRDYEATSKTQAIASRYLRKALENVAHGKEAVPIK